MSQRPSINDANSSCNGSGSNNINMSSSAVQTTSENLGIATIVDSDDDDVQFVQQRLQPLTTMGAAIDLCVSPSTSAAAAAAAAVGSNGSATATNVLKNATDSSTTTATVANNTGSATSAGNIHECPICLQTCIHPARLPCGHIFCFLCVKGVAYKNRRCAMCRREIPPEFLDHPQLVNGIDDICSTKSTEDGYQWYYEGRNGWWQYDDRTSQDIEEAYKKGDKSCTILVAGYVYIVDLEALVQQRQNEPSRCRRVKRDLATIPKKGVAGLRIEGNIVTTDSNFANQLQLQQQHPQQRSLRLSSADFISTIVATDAAIRIASDIIGSTLAHADELTRGLSAHNAIGSSEDVSSTGEHVTTTSTTSTTTTANNLANIQYNSIGGAAATMPPPPPPRSTPFTAVPYAGTSTSSVVPSESNLNTIQDLMRSATEDLLGTTQQVIETNQHSLDLFEQALNDFQTFSLRNIMDSSEEEPDDDVEEEVSAAEVAVEESHNVETAAAQQSPNDINVNRSLRF